MADPFQWFIDQTSRPPGNEDPPNLPPLSNQDLANYLAGFPGTPQSIAPLSAADPGSAAPTAGAPPGAATVGGGAPAVGGGAPAVGGGGLPAAPPQEPTGSTWADEIAENALGTVDFQALYVPMPELPIPPASPPQATETTSSLQAAETTQSATLLLQPPPVHARLEAALRGPSNDVAQAWAEARAANERLRRGERLHAVASEETNPTNARRERAIWRERAPVVEMRLVLVDNLRYNVSPADLWSMWVEDYPDFRVPVLSFAAHNETFDNVTVQPSVALPRPPDELRQRCTVETLHLAKNDALEGAKNVRNSAQALWMAGGPDNGTGLRGPGRWLGPRDPAKSPPVWRLLSPFEPPKEKQGRLMGKVSNRGKLADRVLDTLERCAKALGDYARRHPGEVSAHELALYECDVPLAAGVLDTLARANVPRMSQVSQTPAATVLWSAFSTVLLVSDTGGAEAAIDWPGDQARGLDAASPRKRACMVEPGTSQVASSSELGKPYDPPVAAAWNENLHDRWTLAMRRMHRALDFVYQTTQFAQAICRLDPVKRLYPAVLEAYGLEKAVAVMQLWRRACVFVGCALERLYYEMHALVRTYARLPDKDATSVSPVSLRHHWERLGAMAFRHPHKDTPTVAPPPQPVPWTQRLLMFVCERELHRLAAIVVAPVDTVPQPMRSLQSLPLKWHVWLHLCNLVPGTDVARADAFWRRHEPPPLVAQLPEASPGVRLLLSPPPQEPSAEELEAQRREKRQRARGRRRRHR